MMKYTVVMVCLNVEARDEVEAFEQAFHQIVDDEANIVTVEPQGGTWHWEIEPG